MATRNDRADAVLEALKPLCEDAADLVTGLSDALVAIYIVGAEDPTDLFKMRTVVDLFTERTMETYVGFIAERGDELREAMAEEAIQ